MLLPMGRVLAYEADVEGSIPSRSTAVFQGGGLVSYAKPLKFESSHRHHIRFIWASTNGRYLRFERR